MQLKKTLNMAGIEMALQVFIVLFVLLAVAMLVLQMLQENTPKEEIIGIMNDIEAKMTLNKWEQTCKALCNGAKRGSLKDMRSYCVTRFTSDKYDNKAIDFDGRNGIGFNDTRDPAWPFCEDTVYCWTITDCYIEHTGVRLNPQTCLGLLCDQNIDVTPYFEPGKCYNNLNTEEKARHWYSRLFGVDGTPKCP